MAYGINRSLSTILAVTLLFQPFAGAQDQLTAVNLALSPNHNWEYASSRAPAGAKVLIITMAQPSRRTACRVRSIANDQLACKGPFGKTRTYKPQEIAAIILPGDSAFQLRLWVGLNAAAGLAAWGTFVLAPACIPCAAATAFAAFAFVCAAGAIAYSDDRPESLIYLAPNKQVLPDAKGRTIRLKNLPSPG